MPSKTSFIVWPLTLGILEGKAAPCTSSRGHQILDVVHIKIQNKLFKSFTKDQTVV